MTLDSVPELARRILHLEMELRRVKPSAGTDNAALLKRMSALEGVVARLSKATPTKPQVYTPKPAARVPKPTNNSLALKLAALEREVERLRVKESPGMSIYSLSTHDHNADYLGISAKAADSDKLDGLDSTDFVKNSELGVWNNWNPTQTGWTALPTGTYRYYLMGKMCFFAIDITAGTSNSTEATLTLPFTVKSGVWYGGVNGLCMNNGVVLSVATKWYIDSVLSRLQFGTDMGAGLFTASGTKRIRCEGFYEIA